MVLYQTDRGGSTVDLSEEQAQDVESLWTSYKQKGSRLPSYSGRDPTVMKAFGFRVSEDSRTGRIASQFQAQREQQQIIKSSTKLNVPFGYSPREVVDIHIEYENKLLNELRKRYPKMNDYGLKYGLKAEERRNQYLEEHPELEREYKQKLQEIYKQPGQVEKMQTYAKGFGFRGDISQYGKEQYILPSGKILPITPENTQKVIESRQEQYLTRELTSTFDYKGKKVPVYKTYLNYYDSETGEKKKREATSSEQNYYKKQTNYLQASQEKAPRQFVQMGQSILPELKGMWEESGISNLLSTEIGLPSFVIPGASITVKEFKGYAKEFGIGGQVLGSIPFPETVGQAGILGAGALAYPVLPKIVQIGVGGYTSVTGIRGAFDTRATTGERIVSGTIGTLAGVGTVFEALPFIKGGLAKLSPSYAPTKVQLEGFKAIELKETRIGLIPEKSPLKAGLTYDVKLPSISPLKRGGFAVTPSQKELFLGEQQYLTTSQISFFKKGISIPLKREFFVTPQEPFIGIPETRISRLGLSDLFKFNLKTQIGFGIPKTPQIGLTIADVGRVETTKRFAIGKGTELEAIKTFGTIQDITKVGVTTIKGQAVQVYTYQIGKGVGVTKAISTAGISKVITPRVSGEATIFTSLGLIKTQSFTPKITTTPVTFKTTIPTYVVTGKYKPTISISPYKATTTYSPPILKPPYSPPTSKPPYSPPTRRTPPRKPPYYPPSYPPRRPPSKPPYYPPRLNFKKLFKQPKGSFSVYVRRRGKFSLLGAGLSLPKAFSLGTEKVRRTLAATFLVKQQRGIYRGKTPKGFYAKPTKLGTLYIEKRGQRLKKGTLEIPEIQYYRKAKSKGGLY